MHNTTDTGPTHSERIAALEKVLVDTERQLIALHQATEDGPPPPGPPPPPVVIDDPPPPPPQPYGDSPPAFRGAEWWLRVSGIAMVVASAIFFVSTAIQRGWIGPVAQLTLATVISLGLAVLSFRFDHDRRGAWRVTFAVGGAASYFASGLVGYVGLDLLSLPFATGWFASSIALFLFLARAHVSQVLVVASVPAASIGAILLGADGLLDPAYLTALGASYALVIVAATHGQGWSFGRSTGGAVGALIASLGFAAVLVDDGSLGLVFTLVGCLLLVGFATAISQAIDFQRLEPSDVSDAGHVSVAAIVEARVMAVIIPWLSVVVGLAIDHVDSASVGFSWSVLFTAGVFALVVAVSHRVLSLTMQLLHGTAALATIAVALVSVFSGPTLLAALLGQAIIATLLALRFRSLEMVAAAATLAAIVGVMTLGLLAHGTLVSGLDLAESAVVLAVLAAIGVGAALLRENEIWRDAWIAPWLVFLGWASATFPDVAQGQMIISILWVLAGSVMVYFGAQQRERNVVIAGLTTLFVTAAKLVFVDLAAVDVLWRAGLFFAVGAVFLRLAFVLPGLVTAAAAVDEDSDGPDSPVTEPQSAGFTGR